MRAKFTALSWVVHGTGTVNLTTFKLQSPPSMIKLHHKGKILLAVMGLLWQIQSQSLWLAALSNLTGRATTKTTVTQLQLQTFQKFPLYLVWEPSFPSTSYLEKLNNLLLFCDMSLRFLRHCSSFMVQILTYADHQTQFGVHKQHSLPGVLCLHSGVMHL